MKRVVSFIALLLALLLVMPVVPAFAEGETATTTSQPVLKSAALKFDGTVGMRFSMYLGDGVTTADVDQYGVMFWTEKQSSDDEYNHASASVKKIIDGKGQDGRDKVASGTYDGYDVKYFVYDVEATQMADSVYVRGFVKNGDNYTYSQVVEYSPQIYAVNKLYGPDRTTDEKLVELIKTMLDFGAAAQKYFDYNLDNLANSIIVDEKTKVADGVYLQDENTYLIYTAAGLQYCATNFDGTSGKSSAGKTFKLATNIDMSGVEWEPWGNGSYYFQGTFDGQGHTISNLTINGEISNNGGYTTAFIGRLGSAACGGTLKNVTFDKANITGYSNVAVAVGYSENGTVENVHVTNSTVTATHANGGQCGDKAGALIGMVGPDAGSVTNCSATNCTVTAARDAAQLIGYAYDNNDISGLSATNVTVKADATGCSHEHAGVVSAFALVGNGTQLGLTEPVVPDGNTYEIGTASEFAWAMAQAQNGNSAFAGKTIKLTADIDFGGATITGFGGLYCNFSGTFDGDGHTVSNFVINSTSECYAGLFNQVSHGAKIKNLTVQDATIKGRSLVGAISSSLNEGSTVENCKVYRCTLIGEDQVGAVVGGVFETCSVSGCEAKDCTLVYSVGTYQDTENLVVGYKGNTTNCANNTHENVSIAKADYVITNAAEFEEYITTLNCGGACKYSSANVILLSDIDLENKVFEVSGEGYAFAGSFDGMGHTVSNYTIKRTDGKNYTGLFSVYMSDLSTGKAATIKNLTVKNGTVISNGAQVAAIVPSANNISLVDNCHAIDCKVSGDKKVGAVTGYAQAGGTVSNCSASGNTIIASDTRANQATIFGYKNGGTFTNNIDNGDNTIQTGVIGTYVADGVRQQGTTYYISNANGLVWCATNFDNAAKTNGKTFKLTADIDMTGVEWTPWGNENQYFNACFDGQNHTISNLTIVDDHTAEDGHAVGFIGRLGGGGADNQDSKTLMNVTFDNANVSGHHWVGVAVGYNEYGSMNGVKVINSKVTATHVEGADSCGDKAGALIGMVGPNAGSVTNCSAEECTVTAAREAAQLIGYGYASNKFVGLSAKNVTVTANKGACDGTNAGIVVNSLVGTRDANNVYVALIAKATIDGYDTAIYDVAGLAAALANGGEITINSDIDMENAWTTVSLSNKNLTLDGGDHTITNLNAPLLNFYGGTCTIKNLTVADSAVVDNESTCLGSGVILQRAEWANLYMDNCHVENTALNVDRDTRTGALVGYWIGGGEIKNCSVDKVEITNKAGAVGGIVGHRLANDGYETVAAVTNCTVSGSTFTTADDGWRVGTVVGTISTGEFKINNVTSTGNTLTQTGVTNPNHELYGRITDGGKLVVDGATPIFTKDDLLALVERGVGAYENVILMKDIDLENMDWAPFSMGYGTFDGNDHTISNLKVTQAESSDNGSGAAFINWTNGNIVNLKIDGAKIVGYHNAGAIVGVVNNYAKKIENCHVKNVEITITHLNDTLCGDKAGAVAGRIAKGVASNNCTAENCTVKGCRDVGQVFGAASANVSTGCSATNVTVSEVENSTCTDGSKGANIRNEVIGRDLA